MGRCLLGMQEVGSNPKSVLADTAQRFSSMPIHVLRNCTQETNTFGLVNLAHFKYANTCGPTEREQCFGCKPYGGLY
jgi:hypothetical protein